MVQPARQRRPPLPAIGTHVVREQRPLVAVGGKTADDKEITINGGDFTAPHRKSCAVGPTVGRGAASPRSGDDQCGATSSEERPPRHYRKTAPRMVCSFIR